MSIFSAVLAGICVFAFLELVQARRWIKALDEKLKSIDDRLKTIENTVEEIRNNPQGLDPETLAKRDEHRVQLEINRMAEASEKKGRQHGGS